MTALNNLISRVKNIFGRKATPATNAATSAEPPTDISVVSDPRLKAALADIEKYLPDNVLLLGGVTSTNDVKWLAAELRKFTNFLMQLCPKHHIQHLAFAFDKTESDDPHFVKDADVTCIRFY